METDDSSFEREIRSRIDNKNTQKQLTDADEKIWDNVFEAIKPKQHFLNTYVKLAIAASIILVLSVSFYLSKTTQPISHVREIATKKLPPKEAHKTDTLNNFQNELSPANVKNHKTKDTFTQTFFSLNDHKKVKLNDGSIVTINNNSKIVFNSFEDSLREITLDGEAYFEVKSNKKVPFKVNFKEHYIKVIGTKFNIRAYKAENFCEVTVTEGKVKLFPLNNSIPTYLTMDMQATINAQNNVLLSEIESENFIYWESNHLNFKKSPLKDVFKILSRKYNFRFSLDEIYEKCIFSGDLTGLSLQDALKVIQLSTNLKIVNKDHIYHIQGEGCE